MMKTMTAWQVLQKESRFLGVDIVDLLKDIKKHGRIMYSDPVVEAYKVATMEAV